MKFLPFLLLIGCGPISPDSPNPLDSPDTRQPTAAEYHRENIREITGNLGYR